MSRITINQDGICLFSDREIIWRALMSKCRQLERILKRDTLSENERRSLQDEYERTFAITENYRSESHGKRNWKTATS